VLNRVRLSPRNGVLPPSCREFDAVRLSVENMTILLACHACFVQHAQDLANDIVCRIFTGVQVVQDAAELI
jgi:hypothetical protein